MPQVRLKNQTGRKVIDGELVRLYPKTTDSFVVAKLSEFGIIGTVSGTIFPGQTGPINLINTVEYSKLAGIPASFTPKSHVHSYSEIKDVPLPEDSGSDGLSAYELAVQEGYSGTLEQWLESLHGIDGIDGIDGSDASVTKENVEAVLTGEISSHSHAGGSGGLTQAQIRRIC